MRIDNTLFAIKNQSPFKQPRYVVRINFAPVGQPTDYVYITSHVGIPGLTTAYDGLLDNPSASSQYIQPDKGVSTIGSLSFTVLDQNFIMSTLMNDKLAAGKGIRKKEAVLYYGYEGLDFSDFIATHTQLIDQDITMDGGIMEFHCSDIQRNLKYKIFKPAKTTLARPMDFTQLHMYGYSSDTFEYCTHVGDSWSDGPGETVTYVHIDDEIVRVNNIQPEVVGGETLYKFTIAERGVLGTVPNEHLFDENTTEADKRPLMEEVVYIELPMVKILYAILNGALYGDGNASWPSKWTVNLSGNLIHLEDFLNIGSDWWNPDDDNTGKIMRFIDEKQQDALSFITDQLLLPYGAIMPVYGNGQLGINKTSNVMSTTPYVLELNKDNVRSVSKLRHDLSGVLNDVLIKWNYDILIEDFSRNHVLEDAVSKAIHQDSVTKTFEFRGIHGARHTKSTLGQMFDNFRDRWSGPPIYLSVECQPSCNTLEIGNVVRVKLPEVRDYNDDTFALDRSFEIQKITVDWKRGVIKLDLFGSSSKAAPIPIGEGFVISDAWYESEGVDLATLPECTLVGAVLHIDTDLDLSGHANATNPSAIYYSTTDLELDSGVVLTINDNVQIRHRGFFQIDGDIIGTGNGIPGAIGDYGTGNPGVGGVYGINESEGGFDIYNAQEGGKQECRSTKGVVAQPALVGASVPVFDLRYDPNTTTLYGLPTELRGVPGSSGCSTKRGGSFPSEPPDIARGGNGGTSGAGLLMIGRGAGFGASGSIRLDGADGSLGSSVGAYFPGTTNFAKGGSGAGGCGGSCVSIMDGSGSTSPNLFSKFYSTRGRVLNGAYYNNTAHVTVKQPGQHKFTVQNTLTNYHSYFTGHGHEAIDFGNAMYRIQYVPEVLTVASDAQLFAPRPAAITLTEFTNTPKHPDGIYSTIKVVVTPPTSNAYDYAEVYYRKLGGTDWFLVGAADDTVTFVVDADGSTIEVFAKSVSYTKKSAKGGTYSTITVKDMSINNDIKLVIVPPAITKLELFNQGNDLEFTGTEPKFAWAKTSTNAWNIWQSQLPAGYGGHDVEFFDYEVKIYNGASLLRTEYTTDNWYLYSLEKATEDGGPYRTPKITVAQRTRQGQVGKPTSITVSNTAPGVPNNVVITPILKGFIWTFDRPTDLDWNKTFVYASTSSGFTPGPSNLIHQGKDSNGTVLDLAVGVPIYIKFILTDAFDDSGTTSGEYSTTPLGITGAEYDTTPPTNPTSLVITTGVEDDAVYQTGWIKLSWTASVDDYMAGYDIKYWTATDSSPQQVSTFDTNYKFVNLVQTEHYYFQVYGKDKAGNLSGALSGNQVCAGSSIASLDQITSVMGLMSSGTIQGPVFQTASSGARIKIDGTNGFQGYNSSSVQTSGILTDGSGFLGSTSDISWTSGGVVSVNKITATTGTIGSWQITSTKFYDSTASIILNAAIPQISIGGGETFGASGIQLRAATEAEFYAGDGSDNWISFSETGGLDHGRATNFRGVDHFDKDGIFERFREFGKTTTSGNDDSALNDAYTTEYTDHSGILKTTQIGSYIAHEGWATSASGLSGNYQLQTQALLSNGIQIERRAGLKVFAGKFSTYRAIKSRFMWTGTALNDQNFSFYSGDETNNYFGFEFTSAGTTAALKAICKKTGGSKYTSATIATISIDTAYTLMCELDRTAATPFVKWYVNDTLVATQTSSTYVPTNEITVADRWWNISESMTNSLQTNYATCNFAEVEFINERN